MTLSSSVGSRPWSRSRDRRALDLHAEFIHEDAPSRTRIGELVHAAKPYGRPVTEHHQLAARQLAERMAAFIEREPLLADEIDGIVPVPASSPDHGYSLPAELAELVAAGTGHELLSDVLVKTRATPGLKNIARAEKARALVGSIEVLDPDRIQGRRLLVLDDLYQSGTTLNCVAELLREAGAASTHGLAATKTLRNDDNVTGASHD